MKSTEFLKEAQSTQSILGEIARLYNIDTDTMDQMVSICRKGKMKLNVIEWLIQISQKCQPFIRGVGWDSCFDLYRGVSGTYNEFIDKRVRIDNRKPKSMDPFLKDEVNKYFKDMYGEPFRDALLTTGNLNHTAIFGNSYIVFPKGDFKFLWNQGIEDFNFALNAFSSSAELRSQIEGSVWSTKNRDLVSELFLNKIVKNTDWHTIDLKAAIQSRAEIMIRCKGYYGIRYKDHADDVSPMLEIMKLAVK